MLLGLLPDVEVVGTAADGREALRLAEQTQPDVVLMDLRMPHLDGAAATRQLRERCPGVRVIVLTTYADDRSVIDALRAGARGYLTKDAGIAEISRAVHAAAAHQTLLDPVVHQRLIAAATGRQAGGSQGSEAGGSIPPTRPQTTAPAMLPDDLTPREAEVLALIAQGRSNREIAAELFVSEATVKSHINHLFAKIEARDRAQAVHYAYTHGLAT